jgi:protein-S-isoprenylcysteine O-methyltransferase Ste14
MDTDQLFNALFWALLCLLLLLRFWFAFRVWRAGERIGGDRAAFEREGKLARAVEWLFLLLLAALVVDVSIFGGSVRPFAFPAPVWLRWVGVALGIGSIGLFAWTHATLGRLWSPCLQLRASHQVITAGPYARIRHPMYTAIVSWMLSLGLIAANWIPFVFATLSALNFLLRIRGEEQMMLDQFGDEYREYMKRTGKLLPR